MKLNPKMTKAYMQRVLNIAEYIKQKANKTEQFRVPGEVDLERIPMLSRGEYAAGLAKHSEDGLLLITTNGGPGLAARIPTALVTPIGEIELPKWDFHYPTALDKKIRQLNILRLRSEDLETLVEVNELGESYWSDMEKKLGLVDINELDTERHSKRERKPTQKICDAQYKVYKVNNDLEGKPFGKITTAYNKDWEKEAISDLKKEREKDELELEEAVRPNFISKCISSGLKFFASVSPSVAELHKQDEEQVMCDKENAKNLYRKFQHVDKFVEAQRLWKKILPNEFDARFAARQAIAEDEKHEADRLEQRRNP